MAHAMREAPRAARGLGLPTYDHSESLPRARASWTIGAAQEWWQALR